ncbi:hypothetical protein [[Clostridium] hylemonae]|nr:hypothetical protein LAJLEIBI_03340 [[Clostridium] hylemonae DSM 15053]
MRHKRPWNAIYSMDVCHFGILFPAEQFVGSCIQNLRECLEFYICHKSFSALDSLYGGFLRA